MGSTLTGVGAFAGYFSLLERRWPIPNMAEALKIGGTWLVLTVAFEFGFGRLVAKQPWEELLADHNLAGGRTRPPVLAWLGVGPAVVRRLRRSEAKPPEERAGSPNPCGSRQ